MCKTFGLKGRKVGRAEKMLPDTVCYEVTLGNWVYGPVAEDLPNTHKALVEPQGNSPALISHPLQRSGPCIKDEASWIRMDIAVRSQAGTLELRRTPMHSEAKQS